MEDVSFSYRAKEEIISKINSKPKADVCMMGMLTYCNCLSDDEISFLTENKAVADFFVLNTGRITGNENAVSVTEQKKRNGVVLYALDIPEREDRFLVEVNGLQNPVFKLKKVVRSKSEEEMQDFEGPLDLILYLLGKNKMEIQDISISLICDQYMAWLARRQEMDLEVASEFVTMASQLVYIKTRMLLSIEDEEAQSEMDALIASLEERKRNENYAKVKSMAARLEPMGEFGRNILTRPPEPVKRGKIYEYDQTPADLVLAMAEIQGRAERSLPPPRSAFQSIVQHEPYPVESKAREILSRLRTHGVTRFLLLFRGSRSRSEVVATFLAVLELCRAHILHLAGSETDCTVRQERELPQDLKL